MAKISKCVLWALSITNEVHGDNYYTTGCMTTDGTVSYKIIQNSRLEYANYQFNYS